MITSLPGPLRAIATACLLGLGLGLAGQGTLSAQVGAWLEWQRPEFPGSRAGWVEVVGYQGGYSKPPPVIGGGGSSGPASASDATLTLRGEALVPFFVERVTKGTARDRVVLQFVAESESGVAVLVEVTWENVAVSNAFFAAAADAPPAISVSFSFERTSVKTTVVPESGLPTVYWDVNFDALGALATSGQVSGVLSPGPFAYPLPGEDSDGDGLDDLWEIEYGFDPRDRADASADPDGDGLSTFQEYVAGTNPTYRDSRLSSVIEETDGVFRISVSVGYGRRVELRRGDRPPAEPAGEGVVVDVIEFSTGDGDALVAPIPTDPKAFYWIVVTVPVPS